MNKSDTNKAKKKIAIVGSGISGLTCAYLLSKKYDVYLFEENDYLGGHTQTTEITVNDKVYPVNTGFIVFNDWTYPNFIKLMDELGVASEDSDMSFSVKCEKTMMEYNGHTLNTLFAQRRNIFNPRFWKMVLDILKFNKTTKQEYANNVIDPSETLGQYLARNDYSDYFKRYYIIPMGAAIWSASEEMMMDFPVFFFIKFFNNHGMLNIEDRPQWRVISHGSHSYVKVMREHIDHIYEKTSVVSVKRTDSSVQIESKSEEAGSSESRVFDEVVFACHSDQALNILGDQATQEETQILSAIPYQMNEVVLHTDSSVLPKRKNAWAAWNYHIGQANQETVAVTYYMNRLQNFDDCPVDFCVTLNKTQDIDPSKIYRTFNYAHPVFTLEGMKAQENHHLISNKNNTHYCGAYWFNGFHEDGVKSALRVCESLGVKF